MSLKSYARRFVSQMRLLWVIWRGRRRFSGDPRYRIDLICTASISKQAEDDDLLRRICAAYRLATERQATAPEAFAASRWWRTVQESNLGPVRRALADGDLDALRAMYRDLFRDPCGAGLVGLPVDMARSYRRPQFQRRYQHLLLIDTLHRMEVWRERTNGRFSIDVLRGPEIGAPFGVVLENVLLRPGATDHHYYAHRIIELLKGKGSPVIAEIGGGFGGLAYYLLRDHPEVTYVDFDVPESIALAAYYLGNAFPDLRLTLYGERAGNCGGISLMPAFSLAEMPADSVDAVFSSHLLPDLDPASLQEYLSRIAHIARVYFLHVDDQAGCLAISRHMAKGELRLAESRAADWNKGCAVHYEERETLYVKSGLQRDQLKSCFNKSSRSLLSS
jgi:hypothetical protein